MKAYIEDRNGNRYEFKNLTRKQKMSFSKKFKSVGENTEEIDGIFADLMKLNYPNISQDEVDDILDYNDEVYGLAQTYELVSTILEEVFTQVGGEIKAHPYLQEKKQNETNQM